jgi:hypothetical protein
VRLFAAYVAVAIAVCLCVGERFAKVVARIYVRLPITRTRYKGAGSGLIKKWRRSVSWLCIHSLRGS